MGMTGDPNRIGDKKLELFGIDVAKKLHLGGDRAVDRFDAAEDFFQTVGLGSVGGDHEHVWLLCWAALGCLVYKCSGNEVKGSCYALAHHARKKFARNDSSLVFGRGDTLIAIIGFYAKAGMFCAVLDEGSGDGDALSELCHTGVVNIDMLSDGEAFIGVEHGVDEFGGGDLHPLDEDVGAEQVGQGRVEGTDAVCGADGKRFGVGCGFHGEIIAWLDGGLGIIWIRN